MLASSGEITEPCPVPLSLTETTPSSRMPALSHFWTRRMMRRSPIRCSRKRISQSWLISSKNDRMSASSMKLTFLLWMPTQRIQRIVCAAPWPEPVREPEEVFLVDRAQQRSHCPLDDLVLKELRPRADAAVHPAWECRPAGTAVPDPLLSGPGRA